MSSADDPMEETAGRSTAPYVPHFLRPVASPVLLTYGAATHAGKVRSRNEDHFAVTRRKRSREILATNVPCEPADMLDDEVYVLVVADGVGGEGFGDRASELAVRTGWDSAGRAASWLMRLDGVDYEEIKRQVTAVAEAIQQAFLARCRESPHFAGMATTWTCAYVIGWDVIIAHVGDSRAYHCRDGRVSQVTRDHTLAEELRKSGMGNVRADKFHSVLTKAFGGDAEEVVPDIHQLHLQDGEAVLLCTDGLSNTVTDEEIGRLVLGDAEPQQVCDALIALALERGAPDNVTVVLARVCPKC
jgi:PPM family protein phosphatase